MKNRELFIKADAAPKDPEAGRSCIYLLLDQRLQGIRRADGEYRSEIYLNDGRLLSKARVVGGLTDEQILSLLTTSSGFEKLVYRIGVTLTADGTAAGSADDSLAGSPEPAEFGLIFIAPRVGGAGRMIACRCNVDGREYLLDIHGRSPSESEEKPSNVQIPGQFFFRFERPETVVTATVRLILNEGYDVADIAPDPDIEYESPFYQELLARSLLQTGDHHRLYRVLEKAKSGKPLTLAFIGGSITQGAGAVPVHSGSYGYLAYQDFIRRYGTCPGQCRFIKAGIGGTSSELGLVRYGQDVEAESDGGPDLVVVEFAVNDLGDETAGRCHESLIWRILTSASGPAVIMLFSVRADDWNLEERLSLIGKRYRLPMISMKAALTGQESVTKRQYFYDLFHPSNLGHRIMADCIGHLFQSVDAAAVFGERNRSDHDGLTGEAVYGRQYAAVRFFDRRQEAGIGIQAGGFCGIDRALQMAERNEDRHQTPQFPFNWMHEYGSGSEPLFLRISCRTLFILIKDSDEPEFGKAGFYVDGRLKETYDPLDVGWIHCNARLLIDEPYAAVHEVQVMMAPGEERKRFTILGFGVI